ncbi:Tudor domain-containing protein 5 [Temnothorax longispinosus]|uniref:Tudor domain-containing protein 5 n=1 Tax=Temnothorax longispinosus TaxID=300112 RepID=A0A4S2KP86_9HYME|nr:Tudor domain-containing protein 5 [Temnothorax longispinosus]
MEIKCIDTSSLSRGLLKVKVTRVDSPTFLWIHLEGGREDLDELIEDLTLRMMRRSEFLYLPPDQIMPEMEVAVHEGRRWQRGFYNAL